MSALIALGAIVIGGIICSFGVYHVRESRRYRRSTMRPNGLVVDRERYISSIWDRQIHDYKGIYRYNAIVRFITANGETAQTAIELANWPPKVGRRMRILYDPENPQDARRDSPLRRGTCSAMFLALFGLVLFVGGVAGLIEVFRG